MRKIIPALIFVLLLPAFSASAQSVSGTITDTTNKKNVQYAVVALLKPADSVLYKFIRTNKDGAFEIPSVKAGKYILMVTHPFFADFVDDVNVPENGLQLNTVSFTPKSKLLQEVIIKTGSPIRIKGDTVFYTADSFKVGANANVEELLKKLPGIQVDKNGQIKAMGEKVEKVLVDGEEFFGDDPGMAVKNLRADAVKEVQVYDKKSEQAEFTGIDDGKKEKTINLKLKEDRKKGYFGKVELAGGLMKKIDNRFNNNLMFNAFKGKRKIAGYLLQGNTGQNGLNWREQQKFGGDDEMGSLSFDEDAGYFMFSSGGSVDDEPYIDTRNGFFNNLNTGLQYSNKWNDKHTLNFSPKFNKLRYDNLRTTFSQTQLAPDTVFNEDNAETTRSEKWNIKNNLVYDAKLDSFNSLKVVTKLNIYHSDNTTGQQSQNRDIKGELNNSRVSRTDNITDKNSFNNSVIFKHKFKKLRRTLSLNTDFNVLSSGSESFLYSVNNFGKINLVDTIDQKKNADNSNKKLLARAAYTEPLSAKYSLELNYEFSKLYGNNDLETFSKTLSNGKYEKAVDSLTNHFEQDIITNKTGFKISFKNKKLKYSLGTAAGFTKYNFTDITKGSIYKRNYTNLFPAMNLNYDYKSNHSISFNYDGNTIQPTINQLQQLRNNSNPLYQYIGNPNLGQSFRHNFNVRHNSYNFIKEIWASQSFDLNITDNAITNSTKINALTGETLTQPVNTNGNISVNAYMGLGSKIKKLDMFININYQYNHSRFVELINSQKNNTVTTTHSLSFYFNKSKEKKYDISMNHDFGFNVNNSSIYNRKIKYNTYTVGLNGSVYFKKVWKLSSDFEFNYRQKTDEFGKDVNNSLWNATFEKTFHSDEFTVFFTVRDILNQNIGIDRTLYGNTLKEVRNDRLQRFWLFGIRWDFKNKGAAPEKK